MYNASHPDLQVKGYLRGNEPVRLTHVQRDRTSISFLLPCIRPVLSVKMKEGQEQSIPANLDTLVFLPEEGIFYQVWRGIISITDPSLNDIEEIVVEYEQLPCSPKSDQIPRYR